MLRNDLWKRNRPKPKFKRCKLEIMKQHGIDLKSNWWDEGSTYKII